MKLSRAWIFDHLAVAWQDFDGDELVRRLSSTTAEIEHAQPVALSFDDFSLVTVSSVQKDHIKAYSLEWKSEIELAVRDVCIDSIYLIKKNGKKCSWASLIDVGSEKEGLMPAISATQEDLKGAWKSVCEAEDVIWHIDNKAITHRPDLWGHRGFAREIAALYNLDLVPEERLLHSLPVKHYESSVSCGKDFPYSVSVQMPETCKRFAACIAQVQSQSSSLFHAVRLARIDAKPLDAVVDATNYVMYDTSQPMHAFDAAHITGNYVTVRPAREKETLKVLDGTTVEMTVSDCVISDDTKALALAGIMGGKDSGVSLTTKNIFFESAHFAASPIRKTATRVKKRTEASARFEKTLDPLQNTQALQRFIRIISDMGLSYTIQTPIVSIGAIAPVRTITVAHDMIVQRLGTHILSEQVEVILHALGFGVRQHDDHGKVVYTLTVPTFRGTKDVTQKEDILEEIGRFVGYNSIPAVMPTRPMVSMVSQDALKIRSLKNHCAYGMGMREVYTYPFFEDAWLKELHYTPENPVVLANPLSQEASQLVTSLIPGLCAVVKRNVHKAENLRFFECGRVWSLQNGIPSEQRVLTAITYAYKKELNFYAEKACLQTLFTSLDMLVEWIPATMVDYPWQNLYQTARLMVNNECIGYAGMMRAPFLHTIGEGSAFICEVSLDKILAYQPAPKKFVPLARYQATHSDISLMVPASLRVRDIEHAAAMADGRVVDVIIRDIFEKPEWIDQRSVTVGIVIQDEHKTMTREEIDQVTASVTQAVVALGASVR